MKHQNDNYEFNCPQYVDFTSPHDENSDSFFDEADEHNEVLKTVENAASGSSCKSPSHMDGDNLKCEEIRHLRSTLKRNRTFCNSETNIVEEEFTDGLKTVVERIGPDTKNCTGNITNVSKENFKQDQVNDSTSSVISSVSDLCEVKVSSKRKIVGEDNSLQRSKTMKVRLDQTSLFCDKFQETDLLDEAELLDSKHLKKLNVPTPKLTIVQPFHFKTDERLRNASIPKSFSSKRDFASCLRRCSPRLQSESKLKITQPQPFSFDVSSSVSSKCEQQIKQKLDDKASKPQLGITQPRSPKLTAVQRNRPITVLSREQLEEKEFEELKKWKFQAKPFDPKLFDRAKLIKPVPTINKISRSKILSTQKSSRGKSSKVDIKDTEKYVFRAQPVAKNILKKTVGLKEKKTLPLTVPKTPKFSVRTRSQKMQESFTQEEEKQISVRRAHTTSRSIEPFSLTFEKRCTEIKPFSFDEYDRVRYSEKTKRIKEEIQKEKKAFEFKANPMPVPGASTGVPVIPKKSPTKPEPFNLMSDRLGEIKSEKWNKSEFSLGMKMEVTSFKAKPATVIQKPPFQPQKSTRLLTEPNSFHLSTEKRAEEWATLEAAEKQKAAANEAELRRLKEEIEHKKKEELAELRKQLVHKANPIRCYETLIVKCSDKPLTQPCSPKFVTSKRINQKG